MLSFVRGLNAMEKGVQVNLKDITQLLIPTLSEFSDQERIDFIVELSQYFCTTCGRLYKTKLTGFERGCQCWNDE